MRVARDPFPLALCAFAAAAFVLIRADMLAGEGFASGPRAPTITESSSPTPATESPPIDERRFARMFGHEPKTPADVDPAECSPDVVPRLHVIATVVANHAALSRALLVSPTALASVIVAPGSSIDGWRVTAIDRAPLRVRLVAAGGHEIVLGARERPLDPLPAPASDEGAAPLDRVSRSELETSEQLAELSRHVRVVPRIVHGTSAGLKLFGIRPGSLLDRLGARNGDVLVEVSGRPLLSFAEALAAYESLQHARELSFVLERAGARTSRTIHVDP